MSVGEEQRLTHRSGRLKYVFMCEGDSGQMFPLIAEAAMPQGATTLQIATREGG